MYVRRESMFRSNGLPGLHARCRITRNMMKQSVYQSSRASSLRSAALQHTRSRLLTHPPCSGSVVGATSAIPTTSFSHDPDYKFTKLINGCWQLAGGHGSQVFDNIEQKLGAHADAGFTTFDTADIYGPSEQILGEFQSKRRDAGKAPVQIFTKYVPNIFQSRPTPTSVEAAVRKSLKALQLDSLDLVQMHWWDYGIPGMVDAAKALADLQAKGLVKHVGLTNMNVEAVAAIVDAGVAVACNQVQFSLLDQRPLNGMVQYCQSKNIKIITYGSVAGGLLSDKYVEQPKKNLFGATKFSYVDLNTSSLKMYWNVAKQYGGQELWRELLLVLDGVAKKHGVSVANVALRWVMQQGGGDLVCPLVGLRSTAHIQDNARVFSFALDEQDMADIAAVTAKSKGPVGDCYSFERGN